MVSHISTCKHFIIPRGATNPEPNHTITLPVRKASLFGFMFSSQTVASSAEQLVQSHPELILATLWMPGRLADTPGLQRGISNSLFLWLMRNEQIIICIPQSLPLQTHRTPCYLNTILYALIQDVLPYDGLDSFFDLKNLKSIEISIVQFIAIV